MSHGDAGEPITRLRPPSLPCNPIAMVVKTRPPPVDRFVLAAAVDRLIYDSDTTFLSEDARTILSMLPRRRTPWFELGLKGKLSGGSTRGMAAGVGSVQIDDKDRTFDYSSLSGARTRAGQWKLLWYGGRREQLVEIEQVMADVTDEGRGALVHYDLAGMPLSMDIRVNRSFSLFWSPIVIVIPAWRPWKRPI